MDSGKLKKVFQVLTLSITLVLVTGAASFAEIVLDEQAIEAEATQLIAAGIEPTAAMESAVANAITAVIAANPEYPGGREALNAAVLDAVKTLNIPGLNTAAVVAVAGRSLGLPETPKEVVTTDAPNDSGTTETPKEVVTTDAPKDNGTTGTPTAEAYQSPGTQGRNNAIGVGGNANGAGGNGNGIGIGTSNSNGNGNGYGPGGKPASASRT